MIFDKAMGLIERHFPDLREMGERARLFVFPGRAHEQLPKVQEKIEFLRDHFFLPFPVVAVEDTAGIIFLADLEKDQKGLSKDRTFVEFLPFGIKAEEFQDGAGEKGRLWNEMNVSVGMAESAQQFAVSKGVISVIRSEVDQYLVEGRLAWTRAVSKDRLLLDGDCLNLLFPKDLERAVKATIQNAMAAIEEIIYFNSPDRFIVERRPTEFTNVPSKRLRRSHERPQFTLLTPNEIRERFGIKGDEGERSGPVPHERRRHFRTLRSDVFTHKKGQVVIVRATWVGKTEFTVGKTQYKIRLDL